MADPIDKKVEQIIERLQESRNIVEYFQQIAKMTNLSAEDAKALEQAVKGVAKDTKDILKNYDGVAKGTRRAADIQKDIAKSLQKEQSSRVEINNLLNKAGVSQSKVNKLLEDTEKNGKILLEAKKKLGAAEYEALAAAVSSYKIAKENTATNEENLDTAKNYNTALGATGGLIGGIAEGFKKMGLDFGVVNDALEEARDKMIEVSEEVTDGGQKAANFGGKLKVMGAGLSSLGGNIAKGLLDPLFLSEQFVSKILEVDEGAGKLAKNFGISYDQALGISKELTNSANTAYLLNVTAAGQAEAFTEINNRYGTFAKVSEKTLETHQQLKDTVGLSAEALGAIADSSILTGKETEDITTEFLGQAKALAIQNNLALNEKQILESVKDISKATLVSLQGQPQALAKAVVQAKALGTTVEKVADISNSLLQFEDSITSELEAELLIGKDLTLEKARQAALNNDIATVAEEIAKQVGTAAQFGEMNVLQQEALAKAVGMTREDLAASLTEREALAKLAGVEGASAKERFDNLVKEVGMEEAKKRLGDESLANMLASQNIQEKFNAAITKLGDILTALAIPVLKIVNPLMDLVNYVLPVINEGFRVMGVMIDYIGSAWNWFVDKLEPIMPVLKGIGIAILAILSPLIAAAGIAAFMAMAGIPVIGPVLAAAAAVGAVSFLTSKMTGIKIQDGMIAPDGGLMVSGKKGTYQLDKNDTVVAGTDLGGGGGGRSTGIDIGPLVAEMQNVRAVLQQILAKEGSVYIDSTKAGTAFAVGASKLQ
jgi:DNA-binding Lrp family transcriptional regulator